MPAASRNDHQNSLLPHALSPPCRKFTVYFIPLFPNHDLPEAMTISINVMVDYVSQPLVETTKKWPGSRPPCSWNLSIWLKARNFRLGFFANLRPHLQHNFLLFSNSVSCPTAILRETWDRVMPVKEVSPPMSQRVYMPC